jgi:preprotein translocase subunit SecG
MLVFATILIMLVAILLVLVVLAQNSKGGGISSSVGISNQVMGAARSTENVEKITWILVGALAICCVASGFVFNQKSVQSGPRNTSYDPKTQFELPSAPQTDPSLTPGNTNMPTGTGTGTTPGTTK